MTGASVFAEAAPAACAAGRITLVWLAAAAYTYFDARHEITNCSTRILRSRRP